MKDNGADQDKLGMRYKSASQHFGDATTHKILYLKYTNNRFNKELMSLKEENTNFGTLVPDTLDQEYRVSWH